MRAASLALAFLWLAGCSAGPPAGIDDPAAPAVSAATGPAGEALQPILLADSREGVLQYRLAGDGAPSSAYAGDPHAFCLQLPEGVLAVDFTLTWDDPRPLLLEFQDNDDRHTTYGDDAVKSFQATSPSTLHVDAPDEGEWQVWIGPGVADAMRAWHLDMQWTVPANMTLDMIEDEGFCP